MDELTDAQREAHTLRNGAGTIIAVTCLACNRVLDGETPKLCGECSKDARAEAREATKAAKTDHDKD